MTPFGISRTYSSVSMETPRPDSSVPNAEPSNLQQCLWRPSTCAPDAETKPLRQPIPDNKKTKQHFRGNAFFLSGIDCGAMRMVAARERTSRCSWAGGWVFDAKVDPQSIPPPALGPSDPEFRRLSQLCAKHAVSRAWAHALLRGQGSSSTRKLT